jgi:hypothetical protein
MNPAGPPRGDASTEPALFDVARIANVTCSINLLDEESMRLNTFEGGALSRLAVELLESLDRVYTVLDTHAPVCMSRATHRHSLVKVGANAAEQISSVTIDLFFMGVSGVHPIHGLTTGEAEEAAIKRSITRRAGETFVLASSEKLGSALRTESCRSITSPQQSPTKPTNEPSTRSDAQDSPSYRQNQRRIDTLRAYDRQPDPLRAVNTFGPLYNDTR